MWRRSAWGMTSHNSKTPILFQRVNRHIRHLNALQSVVYWNTLDIVKENTAIMGFSCVLFLSTYECFCSSCVCMHCVCACVCRGQRAQNPSEWNYGQLYAHGGWFCEGSKCSFTTNMSQPLPGHFRLHIWLALFFCNRIAPEAADPTVQVSFSFHIICLLLERNTLKTCKCSWA